MNNRTSFTLQKSETVNCLRETVKKIAASKNKTFEETFIVCLSVGCFELMKTQSIEKLKSKDKKEV